MKLHLPANNCRTLAFSLVAIVGLSSAFVPGQALARKHKAKAVAAPAAVKAKASPWAGTSTSTDAEKPAKPAGRVSVASGKGKGKGRPGHLTRAEQHDANKICVDSFNTAKERRESGHLIEAREFLSKCARKTCTDFLQQECTTLYTQLEADVPTVVPVVTDDTGAPHALAEVRMDGELLTSKIDGHALQVDPGKHEFSFGTEAGVFATLKAMIVQGPTQPSHLGVAALKAKGRWIDRPNRQPGRASGCGSGAASGVRGQLGRGGDRGGRRGARGRRLRRSRVQRRSAQTDHTGGPVRRRNTLARLYPRRCRGPGPGERGVVHDLGPKGQQHLDVIVLSELQSGQRASHTEAVPRGRHLDRRGCRGSSCFDVAFREV